MSSTGVRRSKFSLSILLPLFLGLLFSCENSGFLPPYEDTGSGDVIASVRSGEVLEKGETITLSLLYDGASSSAPDSLEIEVIDPFGESLGTEIIRGTDLLGDLPPVEINDDRQGLYSIRTRLFDDQGELIREKTVSFFKVETLPVIKRIEVYPPEAVSPGASGVMIPELEEAENAWLRWTMGSELLGRGSYEEYREGFIWKAPASEGVFTVLLEVFPDMPADPERGFDFDSPVNAEVQFFVQRRIGSAPGELGPEDRFRNLFHLRGSLEDRGVRPSTVRVEGNPKPAVEDGVFGYRFGPQDALLISDLEILPGEGNGVPPFSIKMIFSADFEDQGNRHILSFSYPWDGELIMLATDVSGQPYLSFSGAEEGIYGAGFSRPDRCREMVVSFFPETEGLSLRWYCNGRCSAIHQVPEGIFPVFEGTELQLGGEAAGLVGLEMLVDEFGLFQDGQDGQVFADEQVFSRWIDRNIGEKAVLAAEGFEGEADDSVLVGPGEEKEFLSLNPEWTRAIVHTYLRGSFSSPEQAFFVFRGAEGTEKVLPVEALGERTFDQNGNPARSEFSFLFGRNGSVCSVSTLDGKKLFETNAWESDPVRLGLRLEKRIEDDPREQELKAPEAVQLGIEELLVTRERTGFASREGEGGYDQKVAALLNQQ